MLAYLHNTGYQVGITGEDIENDDVKWFANVVGNVATLAVPGVGHLVGSLSGLVKGGVDSSQIFPALIPYVRRADAVALAVDLRAILILVIYADAVAPAELESRFDEFLASSRRLDEISTFRAAICPLLVYFDPDAYDVALDALQHYGPQIGSGVFVQPHLVNVVDAEITPLELPWWSLRDLRNDWAEMLRSLRGKREAVFDLDDLFNVLEIADQYVVEEFGPQPNVEDDASQ